MVLSRLILLFGMCINVFACDPLPLSYTTNRLIQNALDVFIREKCQELLVLILGYLGLLVFLLLVDLLYRSLYLWRVSTAQKLSWKFELTWYCFQFLKYWFCIRVNILENFNVTLNSSLVVVINKDLPLRAWIKPD